MADDEITEILPIPRPPEVRDDPDAPSFFVDWMCGGGPLGPNYSLTLGAIQYDHGQGGVNGYVRSKVRLTIPLVQAKTWAEGILRSLEVPADDIGPPPSQGTKH